MAENFSFGLDIDVTKALSNIDKLEGKLDRLTNAKRDNNDVISQKDFNNASRDLNDLMEALSEYKSAVATANSTSNKSLGEALGLASAISDIRSLESHMDSLTAKYRKFSQGAKLTASGQFDSTKHRTGENRSTYRHLGQDKGYSDTKSRYAENVRNTNRDQRAVQTFSKQIRSGTAISQSDYNKAWELQQRLTQTKNTGIKAHDDKIRAREGEVKENDERARQLMGKDKKHGLDEAERRELNNIIERNKVAVKELRIMEEYQSRLEDSVRGLEDFTETLETASKIRPDRTTARGMAYDRAPSIGMAMMGISMGTVASQFSKGKALKDGMLEDNLAIGTRTGNFNYHDIRKDAGDAGSDKRVNMSETEMLKAQNAYMGSAGFQGQEDLTNASIVTGTFARGMGLTVDQSTEATQTFAQRINGANSNTVKDMQNAFAGALKESGMTSQASQQLSALNGILNTVGSNRGLDEDDVNRIMNMQQLLAGTGDKSLQGEAGANLMTGMDDSIKGLATDNNTINRLMATGNYGTDSDAYFRAQSDLREGLNGKGIGNILQSTDQLVGQTDAEGTEGYNLKTNSLLNNTLGTNYTQDQTDEIMKLYKSGKLIGSDGYISKAGKDVIDSGSEAIESNASGYADTSTANSKRLDDSLESVQTATSDVADSLKAPLVSSILQTSGAFGTLMLAMTAFGATVVATTASLATSQGLKSLIGGRGGRRGGTGGGRGGSGGTGGGRGGSGGGGGIGGWFGGRGSGGNGGTGGTGGSNSGRGGIFSRMFGGGSSTSTASPYGGSNTIGSYGGANGQGAVQGATRGSKWGTIGKSLGKGAGVLGIGLTALSMTNDLKATNAVDKANGVSEKTHNANTGSIIGSGVGGIGGGIAGGALAGSAIGSIVPGVGTAIGGIVGGIGGGIAGSGIGGWIGKHVGGLFGSDSKKTGDSETSKESSVSKKEDETVAKKKLDAEEKRAKNIAQDEAFLNQYNNAMGRSTSGAVGGTSSNVVADDSSETYATGTSTASDTSTATTADTSETGATKTSSTTTSKDSLAVNGTIKVEHSGTVQDMNGVTGTINSVNSLLGNKAKAVLPSGNETRLT